jgi:hypothetical protein
MVSVVHVFAGSFVSRSDACLYTEEQWEAEPDDSVSDEEYVAWEDRNPVWALRDEIDSDYLSADFIETIDGERRLDYVKGLLASSSDQENLAGLVRVDENILVLIFNQAFDGHRASPRSTSKLRFLGSYSSTMPR